MMTMAIGTTDQVILRTLARAREGLYGVDLATKVGIKPAAVFKRLDRLRASGHVCCVDLARFTVTDKGRKQSEGFEDEPEVTGNGIQYGERPPEELPCCEDCGTPFCEACESDTEGVCANCREDDEDD